MWCILPIVLVLGTVVGSFLNVVSERLPKNKSIRGRSKCDFCKHKLSALDLVPILSFLALRGKCRYCRKKLSWQYPLVELVSGILFVLASYLAFGFDFFYISPLFLAKFVFLAVLFSCLLSVFITDLKYGIILDEVVLFGSIITFLYLVFVDFFPTLSLFLQLKFSSGSLAKTLLETLKYFATDFGITLAGGFLVSLFFFVILAITRGRGMGAGDVKLGFLIGLASGVPLVLVSLFLSFLSGALVSLFLIVLRRRKFGQTIPFGPFLSLGTFLALVVGQQVIDWYTKFSGF
jgi:leader peptidase (prepilin peptidase)/N-methyltransferase